MDATNDLARARVLASSSSGEDVEMDSDGNKKKKRGDGAREKSGAKGKSNGRGNEPGIAVAAKHDLETLYPPERNEDLAREEDIIEGFRFLSYPSIEDLTSDATHDAKQPESTSSSQKKEIASRFTVDISDGRFQVNWRNLAADTENNNIDSTRIIKGRRSERYKEGIRR